MNREELVKEIAKSTKLSQKSVNIVLFPKKVLK